MQVRLRAIVTFAAATIASAGLGLGLLAMRTDPARLIVEDGKKLKSVVLGCRGNTATYLTEGGDRLEQLAVSDVIVVALNPEEPGGKALCDTAVKQLPIYWQITPQAACRRLIDQAREEAGFPTLE